MPKLTAQRIAHYIKAMTYAQKSKAFAAMHEHPGAWVHFTKGIAGAKGVVIPKLGINPGTPFHNNPPGIYFYKNSYLIDHEQELSIKQRKHVEFERTGGTYAARFPFYYVCDVAFDTHGIDLIDATDDEVSEKITSTKFKEVWDSEACMRVRLSRAPGDMNRFERYLEAILGVVIDVNRVLCLKYPGALMYALMKGMFKSRLATWGEMLKGVSYLVDNGKSIIHPNEPQQLIVMRLSNIHILEQGRNLTEGLTESRLREVKKAIYEFTKANGFIPSKGEQLSYYSSTHSLTFTVGEDNEGDAEIAYILSTKHIPGITSQRFERDLNITSDLDEDGIKRWIESIKRAVDLSSPDTDKTVPNIKDEINRFFGIITTTGEPYISVESSIVEGALVIRKITASVSLGSRIGAETIHLMIIKDGMDRYNVNLQYENNTMRIAVPAYHVTQYSNINNLIKFELNHPSEYRPFLTNLYERVESKIADKLMSAAFSKSGTYGTNDRIPALLGQLSADNIKLLSITKHDKQEINDRTHAIVDRLKENTL